MSYDFVAGDTGSALVVTCKDNETGAVIDLTGASVKIRWKDALGTVVTKAMSIENAAGGIVKYQFLDAELFSPRMQFEVEITDATGKIIKCLSLVDATVRSVVA